MLKRIFRGSKGDNVKISTRGRYALHFMIYLAQHESGCYIALKDVSENQGISIKYLEQIAALLTKSSLVLSVRGPQGGYKLSRAADKYSVGEILRITEGDFSPVALDEEEALKEKGKEQISTQQLWEGLRRVVENYLDDITLQDLVDQNSAQNNFVYMI